MNPRRALVAVVVASCAAGSLAQTCTPHWETPYRSADVSAEVRAQVIFDDGSGPTLYIGGMFRYAGGNPTSCVARWDGSDWRPLGDGLNNTVFCLTVFDDGTGPALYAGGDFIQSGTTPVSRVAKWNGTSWQPLGAGFDVTVRGLGTYDDGAGRALYAAGLFNASGPNTQVRGIARWNGQSWVEVGGGLRVLSSNGTLAAGDGYALREYDEDGAGPARPRLIVTGDFDHLTIPVVQEANNIAAWDGAAWTTLGDGLRGGNWGTIGLCLNEFDDGTGRALYVGGLFDVAGGVPAEYIARWRDGAFAPVGGGFDYFVNSIETFDAGAGPELYAGGAFGYRGDDPNEYLGHVARWDGESWHALAEGVSRPSLEAYVRTLLPFDMGTGPALMVGGTFSYASGFPAANLCRWDGTNWDRLRDGFRYGPTSLIPVQEGANSFLYSRMDEFGSLGTQPLGPFVRFDGNDWTTIDLAPLGYFRGVQRVDAGDGPRWYATADDAVTGITQTYRQISGGWEAMPSPEGRVGKLVMVPTGSQRGLYTPLYDDNTPYSIRLARWDGTQWTPVPNSVLTSQDSNAQIRDMIAFDDGTGSGPALYVCGYFRNVNGVFAPDIAKWTGQAWTRLWTGLWGPGPTTSYGFSLCVYDDGQGAGPALYVAGTFATAGGLPARGIARWSGTTWTAVGAPMNAGGSGNHLFVFDDGSGDSLFLAGSFTGFGTTSALNIAKWNGRTWAPCGGGLGGSVTDAARFDAPSSPTLWVCGGISNVEGHSCAGPALWVGCPNPCRADWDHSGSLDSTDFFNYLGSFFSSGGEFNADGVIDSRDLFDFLTAYFTGCP